jgi:hypothetical protein
MGIYGYLYIVSNTHYYCFLAKVNNFYYQMILIDRFIKHRIICEKIEKIEHNQINGESKHEHLCLM